jgi:hypothetical protein
VEKILKLGVAKSKISGLIFEKKEFSFVLNSRALLGIT